MIDIHVNTEVLTAGLVIPSGRMNVVLNPTKNYENNIEFSHIKITACTSRLYSLATSKL